MSDSIDLSLFYTTILAHLKKIATLEEDNHHLVDCNYIQLATKTDPRPRQIWADRLASRQLRTGTVMQKRGLCTTPKCPRGCVHMNEDTEHLFQCTRGDKTWKNSRKKLQLGEQNRAAPQMISALLHGISYWQKGTLPPLPLSMARAF